ncbi:MAG: hypothetical protein R3B09_26960 [Nannocystaceae bacterium]
MPENDGLVYGLTDNGFVPRPYLRFRAWVIRKAQKTFSKNAWTVPSRLAGRHQSARR